ncbi:hypothetical protein BDP27DRAFT_1449570 [Rhodocollybia butyracea]|uniref:Uncharacterized protein n=1 Tax=Rhodocollybia butyracea TaxID=206335 RepID=A0A9P5PNT5_9AGAR|nr:hypothetical protein BDP27DRAFT_1449570 [Rhodocollybia butyracea]
MYHVFLGAPSAKSLLQQPQDETQHSWITLSSSKNLPSTDLLPPPATLEAASRRISLMYQNAIFRDNEQEEDQKYQEESQEEETRITWLPTPLERDRDISHSRLNNSRSFFATTRFESQLETQETQESQSMNYSDSSSIARFPNFHFNLHSLTSLATIRKSNKPEFNNKVNVLLAVLEVEGPDTIRTKKGPDAGKEISILKMILGDEDGM